jgi:hemolysin III
MTSLEAITPKYRGVSHKYAFFASLLLGFFLIDAADSEREIKAMIICSASLSGLLLSSSIYHLHNWKNLRMRWWARRIDHCMIFVLIAGTATPFAMLVVGDAAGEQMLWFFWGSAAIGSILKLVFIRLPDKVHAMGFVLISWAAVVQFPALQGKLTGISLVLLVLGGVSHTIGAAVYAFRRPDPLPDVFGYHEVFHLFMLAGAGAHAIVISGLLGS